MSLVEYVKAYASEHYSDGGWDVVVECWEDSEIGELLTREGATTETEAVAAFASVIDVWTDRQADAEFHAVQALGVEGYEQHYGAEPRWHGKD